MKTVFDKVRPGFLLMLIVLGCVLLFGGCTRYARNVNPLYEPAATIHGGSGDVYVVIPEDRQTRSTDTKWVIGKVRDDENREIDEVFSARSPEEIIQAAFCQELKSADYTVIPTVKRPAAGQLVIDLARTEIELEQTSDLADLKAKCRVLVRVDVFRDGQQVKRLQYEATSSRTDIKDRDLLATEVLQSALHSVMLKSVPELHGMIKQ